MLSSTTPRTYLAVPGRKGEGGEREGGRGEDRVRERVREREREGREREGRTGGEEGDGSFTLVSKLFGVTLSYVRIYQQFFCHYTLYAFFPILTTIKMHVSLRA